MELKYFTEDEFIKIGCHSDDCDALSLQKLDELREKCGFPLVLNSAYRTSEHDKERGRSGTGAHTLGRAFDISCLDGRKRAKIVRNAFEVGFNRIGIYPTFVHVDDMLPSEGFTCPTIWVSFLN